jgi:chromate transporter
VSVVVLYLLLLKATVTSFSGLSSLPVLRQDLVVHHGMLSDRELNLAVTAGRSGPGPNGLYVVSVGYLVAGIPGACAGWLAMVTPAFLVVPLLALVGTRAEAPRVKNAIRSSTVAGAALLLAATLPLSRSALTGPWLGGIALASFAAFSLTRIDSVWVIVAAALVGLAASVLGVM